MGRPVKNDQVELLCRGQSGAETREGVGVNSRPQLGERFFHEIITNPLPINMKILKAMKRSPLGLDLYLWLTYRTFGLTRPLRLT